MVDCNCWNIKYNTKSGIEDLYSSIASATTDFQNCDTSTYIETGLSNN